MTIALVVLAVAAVMIAVEVARPGRCWPQVTGWWVRAAALNGVQAGMVFAAGALYLLVGLGPEAASGAVLLTGLAELVYHWNVRTPYWLGFLVQRPESHCIHHQEGVHAYNYADLPVWDILFGTFRNPPAWDARCGFGPEGEGRLAEMLLGVDIHAAPAWKVRP